MILRHSYRGISTATATAIASGFAVNILTLLASLVFGALALGYMRVIKHCTI